MEETTNPCVFKHDLQVVSKWVDSARVEELLLDGAVLRETVQERSREQEAQTTDQTRVVARRSCREGAEMLQELYRYRKDVFEISGRLSGPSNMSRRLNGALTIRLRLRSIADHFSHPQRDSRSDTRSGD